tara:strand:+ start:165 stop:413 length:249 start_codon:yes stop_codon:yes gene_type:complete
MTPTITQEHLTLFALMPFTMKATLRLLSKSMKFRDLVDFLIGDESLKDDYLCVLLSEIAYNLDDKLELILPPSAIKVTYSLN